jgi:hypothetical protein
MNGYQDNERYAEGAVHDMPQMKDPFGSVEKGHSRNEPRLPAKVGDNPLDITIVRGQPAAQRGEELTASEGPPP